MTIKRLIIIHLKFYELSTGKSFLSEDASDDELIEHVLYYRNAEHPYDSALYPTTSLTEDNSHIQELLDFSSLCTALFSLPGALDASCSDDSTHEVFFSNSSLAFKVIEEPNIVAVIQIAAPGSPSAVSAALNWRHQLFSLLRGGGIDFRLRQPSFAASLAEDEPSYCRYPGMNTLYGLRERRRKLAEQRRRECIEEDDFQMATNEIEVEVEHMLRILPITNLREELRIFYDAFLIEYSHTISLDPGRSIVEKLPRVTVHNAAGGTQHTHGYSLLTRRLKQFLAEEGPSTEAGITAIYAFVDRQIAVAESLPGLNDKLTMETAVLLFEYLSSYQSRMQEGDTHYTEDRCSRRPRSLSFSLGQAVNQRRLRSFSFSLGQAADQANVDFVPTSPLAANRFLSPPPLALLSACEDADCSFQGPSNEKAWAPLVALPAHDGIAKVRICLYSVNQSSFLLFLRPPRADESETSYKQALIRFDQEFNNFERAMSINAQPSSALYHPYQHDGCDIVIIDRISGSVSIILSPITSESDTQKDDMHEENGRRRFLQFYRNERATDTQQPLTMSEIRKSTDLESRSALASRLSADAVQAFDDAMAEMSCTVFGSREMLVSLAGQWLFACTDCKKEMYSFFDSKQYVTVADVEKTAMQLRVRLVDTAYNPS